MVLSVAPKHPGSHTYRIDTRKEDVAYDIIFKVNSFSINNHGPVHAYILDKRNNETLANTTWMNRDCAIQQRRRAILERDGVQGHIFRHFLVEMVTRNVSRMESKTSAGHQICC